MQRNTHTHRGSCQVCGSDQAVDRVGQRIARHGYTLALGWQSGTCSGSGFLPFELSCDRVADSIEHAQATAARLEASAAALGLHSAESAEGFALLTVGYTRRQAVRAWQSVTFEAGERGAVFYAGRSGVRERVYGAPSTPAVVAAESRRRYAAHLRAQVGEARAYAGQQAERLAGWAPRPLRAVAGAL